MVMTLRRSSQVLNRFAHKKPKNALYPLSIMNDDFIYLYRSLILFFTRLTTNKDCSYIVYWNESSLAPLFVVLMDLFSLSAPYFAACNLSLSVGLHVLIETVSPTDPAIRAAFVYATNDVRV